MVSEPKDQQEPSMEEILSSIRKIIADEESEDRDEGPEPGAQQQGADEDEEEDVLELTEVVRESGDVVEFQGDRLPEDEPAAVERRAIDNDDIPEEVELTPEERNEPFSEPPRTEPSPERAASSPAEELMPAAAAAAAVGAAAGSGQASEAGSGKSVEHFVADLLRPMLHQWLEENLPPIVERLVQEEIEKLAKRAELL